jgi:hypothetical protein
MHLTARDSRDAVIASSTSLSLLLLLLLLSNFALLMIAALDRGNGNVAVQILRQTHSVTKTKH